MKNKIFNNKITINYEGLNWNNFQNLLLNENISIYNISKNGYNNITFSVSKNDYNKITKNKKFSHYKLNVQNKVKSLNCLVSRMGVVIGLLISVFTAITLSRITLHFNISGLETIDRKVVEKTISDYGIKIGKVNDFDNSDFENYILQNVDGVSFVSIIRKGTTICVNIKEKDDLLSKSHINLISPYNMIITDFSVISGTISCKIGDVVSSGKVLISNYNSATGDECAVNGCVSGIAWWVGSVKFFKQEEILVPTGKSKTYRRFLFGKKSIANSSISSPYSVYKMSYSESDFLGNFLPVKFATTTFVECEKQVVFQNLEENKQNLLQESRLLAYNKVPSNISITNEEQKVIDMGEYYLVSTYLSAEVEVKNAD